MLHAGEASNNIDTHHRRGIRIQNLHLDDQGVNNIQSLDLADEIKFYQMFTWKYLVESPSFSVPVASQSVLCDGLKSTDKSRPEQSETARETDWHDDNLQLRETQICPLSA